MSPEEMMLESVSAGMDVIAILFALAYLWKLWLAAQACRTNSPMTVPVTLRSATLGSGAVKRSLEHQFVARRAV